MLALIHHIELIVSPCPCFIWWLKFRISELDISYWKCEQLQLEENACLSHQHVLTIYIYINSLLSSYFWISCSVHEEGNPWVDFWLSDDSGVITTIQTLNSISLQRKINPLLVTQRYFYLWQRLIKIFSEFAIAVIYHYYSSVAPPFSICDFCLPLDLPNCF